MSDLYLAFNVTFVDLLGALDTSFGDSNASVRAAKERVTELFSENRKTVAIFEQYQPYLTEACLNAINARDCKSLFALEDNQFVADLGGKEIFNDLKSKKEHGTLWTSLQTISKHAAIINATGSSLGVFENIAKTFVSNNKDLDPSQYQTALFSQLFSDASLSDQLLSAFDKPDSVQQILSNIGPILNSLAPATEDAPDPTVDELDDDDEDDDNDDNENDKADKDAVDTKEDDNADDRDNKPSRVFARQKKARISRRKKERRKKKKNAAGGGASG